MSKLDLILKNCLLVNEDEQKEVDIGIKGDRIEIIAKDIAAEAEQYIDVQGKYVAPGIIDDQVHFRDPGLIAKGDISSESKAAVIGGVTSTFDMPNVDPATTTSDLLVARNKLGAEKSWTNYSYYLGATDSNIEDIKRLDPAQTCGIKIFMGSSTGSLLVEDDESLEKIFASCPVTIVTHCEDNEVIKNNLEKVVSSGVEITPAYHPIIRDDEACYKSSEKAVSLAKKYNSDLHILHLTSEKELSLFEKGDINNKRITCEVCVHHLWFDESDYADYGNYIKCNPSVKKNSDREALRAALKDTLVDLVATDHAPHVFEEKKLPFMEAPAGLPLIEHSLQMMIELHKQGIYTLEEVIKYMTHKVADRFDIKDRGYVREGYKADFVIFDTSTEDHIKNETEHTKCGWSPFHGQSFSSSVYATIVNGQVAVLDGKLVGDHSFAERLQFDR